MRPGVCTVASSKDRGQYAKRLGRAGCSTRETRVVGISVRFLPLLLPFPPANFALAFYRSRVCSVEDGKTLTIRSVARLSPWKCRLPNGFEENGGTRLCSIAVGLRAPQQHRQRSSTARSDSGGHTEEQDAS